MDKRRQIPLALQIVAVLFLVYGVSSVLEMIVRLAAGSIHLDFGVLGIPTYFGLRRFSVDWRTFALVCIWLGLIICPVLFIIGLNSGNTAYFNVIGIPVARIAPIWLTIVSVPFFLLELWQYRVLTRPDIRALFYIRG